MFSESVDQKAIMPISAGGKRTDQKLPPPADLAWITEDWPEAAGLGHHPGKQPEGDDQHERRRPVLEPADRVHPSHDDEDVDRPENGKAQPEGPVLARNHRRVRPTAAEQLAGEPVERAPADPGLDAEPATGPPAPD